MTTEALRTSPISRVESFANSLPDQEENQLISAFLENPIIAAKIEQTPDYFRKATSPQDKLIILGDIAGWAFEWLSFTHLQQHTKHTLFSPQNVSDLFQKLYPTRELKDFFFQGKLLNNITIPDMIEVRDAERTLQITRVIEARAGKLDNGFFTLGSLYRNFHLGIKSWKQLAGQAMHEIKPDLKAKPAFLSPNCKVIFAVTSSFHSPQSKYQLERTPISSATLHRLVRTIASGSI